MIRFGDDFRLFAGRANPVLAQEIADLLGIELGKVDITNFPDSETHVQIGETVRGKRVFFVQPTGPSVNDNLMELLIFADACKRASAEEITAIIPYFGYARQDHKTTGREPISAKLAADLITVAGVNRVVTVDLHSPQIQGFFNIPVDHLTPISLLAEFFSDNGFNKDNAVLVSPDVGRAKVVEKYVDMLGLPMALAHKRRKGVGGGSVEVQEVVGDVRGKRPIIIDDLIAAASIFKLAEFLVTRGALPACIAATHAVFVGEYAQRLSRPAIREVVATNSLEVPEEKRLEGKIKVLSLAPLLSKVIGSIYSYQSVSKVLNIDFPV